MTDYLSMLDPTREVPGAVRVLWEDAGFMGAINGRAAIAAVFMTLENAFSDLGILTEEEIDLKTVGIAFDGLTGAVRSSLLKMALPENASLRNDVCDIYPIFDIIFREDQFPKFIFNLWVENLNQNYGSPAGNMEFLDDLMQAFTKENGDFVFEWAGDFDDSWFGGSNWNSFKNTHKRLYDEYEKQYKNKRNDNPPVTPNPWECMIGASRFYIPPINIKVSQPFKVSSLTGASIRQKASPKFNSGHSETMISMTLYFPNQDTIWGIGANEKLDIDFSEADDNVIDQFISSLRGLVTQFKYAPFLPIKNAYINQGFGVTGVTMHSMSVSTIPDYPFCVAVQLNMMSFNHQAYLPGLEDFSNAIHWGRYRQYIGRAAEKMATELYAGYRIQPQESNAFEKIGDSISKAVGVEVDQAPDYEALNGYNDYKFTGFDRQREIYDARNLSIYYPLRTPLQVFAPDLSEWRSQGENEVFINDKNLWQEFLGFLGVDVNTNKDAQYEMLVNSYIPNSKNLTPLSAFVDFGEYIKANLETVKSEDIERFISSAEEKYKERNKGVLPQSVKDQIRKQTMKDWLNAVYGGWKNTDFYKKYADAAQKENAAQIIKEWDLPMQKFVYDNKSVIIDAVSVSLSNTFAKMQIQMQDEPAYQHIGSGDSMLSVSLTIIGSENIARFRELFNHINGLARLEHAHGVIGFLGIKNLLAGICGIKYVMPLNFEVDTIEGYPDVYKARIDFVDFDVFQQKREELSSDQQIELIKNFSKRNPFLRMKQLWGATNCYPDLPLSVRDNDGNIVGHLDPDFYFKAYQTIDDETVNYLPKQEYRLNQKDEIPDDSRIYDQINEALQAERVIGQSYHLRVDGTIAPATPPDESGQIDIPVDIAITYAWTAVEYNFPDGASYKYDITFKEDMPIDGLFPNEEPGKYTLIIDKNNFDSRTSYAIYDYDGVVTGFFVPDESGGHKLASNPGVPGTDDVYLSNSSVYGDSFDFKIDHFFPSTGAAGENSIATLRQDANGVFWGSTDIDTADFEKEGLDKIRLSEDAPSRSAPSSSLLEDTAPFAQHTNEYDQEAKNSYGQFEMMMKDTQYRNKSGRMVRAFPTYMLWLIDEGGYFAGVKLFDNFYGLNSVQDFSVHQSQDILGDTLELSLSNLYQKLSRPSEVYASLGAPDNPYKNEDGTGLIDLVFNRGRNIISGMTSDIDVLKIGNIRLKPGVRVHLRSGYSANPNALTTLFNGIITEVIEGDVVKVIAQSDAIELSAPVNTSEPKGDSGKIDGGLATNLWLSEPRDLMVTLLTQGVSTFKQHIANATKGFVFSENKYGIRHFGHILYEPLSDDEKDKSTRTRDLIGNALVSLSTNVKTDFTETNNGQLGYEAFSGTSSIRESGIQIMQQMWSNLFAARDYEIFKRNIYPGNGTGVAQFLGGDLLDGGEMLAIAGLRPNTNNILEKQKEANDGVAIPSPITSEAATNDSIADGSSQEDRGQGTDSNLWDVGWAIVNQIIDDPISGADIANQTVNPGYSLFRNWNTIKDNPIMKIFGLSGEVSDDDLKGFDEVSFRAQTYMKSVWDLFKVCANLLPNYIVAVRPFEDRSTVFYGKPHWLYTSGVVPLTTGIPEEYELPEEGPQEELENLINKATQSANPIKDFEDQFEQLKALSTVSYIDPTGQATQAVIPEGAQVNNNINDPSLMGSPSVTPAQIATWWKETKNKPDPSFTSILNLATVYIDVGKSEGVRGDLAFVQAIHETGWFTANYAVNRFNFAGIGAYDTNPDNAYTYDSYMEGATAHIQLLKKVVFGNSVQLANSNVAPTWGGRQTATLKGLTGNWATDPTYDTKLASTYKDLLSYAGVESLNDQTTSQLEKQKEEDEANWSEEDMDRYREAVASEQERGAFAPNILIWYPKSLYSDQTKNVGEAARLLYDQEYYLEQNPDKTFWGLGDADLAGKGRNLSDANRVWKDLRIAIQSYDNHLSEEMFKSFFAQRHPALLSLDDLVGLVDTIDEEEDSDFQVIGDNEGDRLDLQRQIYFSYVRKYELYDEARADEVLNNPELGDYFKQYQYLVNNFLRFLWFFSYNRAWVVMTADRVSENSVIPFTTFDIDTIFDKDYEANYNFDRIEKLWIEYLDEFDNGKQLSGTFDYNAQTTVPYSEALWEWMANNNHKGEDTGNSIERSVGNAVEGATSAINELITATATAIAGVVNLFRTQLMQLGVGMSLSGQMQKSANVLNAVFNDSIYYSAGDEGSLLRLADNPFTREYGEPVVEIREPFQRIHYIDSFQHILKNTISENTSNVFTKITAVSDGSYPVTVYLDKGIPSNMQYETTIETGIYWDNPYGKGFFSFLHPLLHPIESSRGMIKAVTASSDELLSRRIGLSHLRESLKDIYGGELWLMGSPDIRPHDLVYMSDVYTRMYGIFEVESVTHHFTPNLGFVTAIVPNAVVTVNDPGRWSLMAWVNGRFAIQTIRNDTRRLVQTRNNENSLFARSQGVTLDELYQSLQTQFKGSIQYTHGSSAIVKDMAALDHYGVAEYAQQQVEEDLQGSMTDAFFIGGLNAATFGLAGHAWDYVKENLLDQQGCYIQYLTKDGQPMDAGLSYAQGIAVGRHHSKTILPGILGLRTEDIVDGNTRITRDDVLSQLGWSEIDVAAVRQEASWWVDRTNSNVLKLAGKSPDEIAFTPPEVHLATVARVKDGDTIELSSYGGDSWGDSRSIRLLGVGAPELLFKDHYGVELDDPTTIIDERNYDEVNLNSPDNEARLIQEYLEDILINKPVSEGRIPVVAIRLNRNSLTDVYGRTLGTVFHNAPATTPTEEIPEALKNLASKWPLIPWDAYLDDGRPYTANWSLISTGLAHVDIQGISLTDYNNGAS